MREIMLIIHFIGLSMFLGTGFAFMFLEIANSKLEKNELNKFSLRILPLSRMGQIGFILLLISGSSLMTPYWNSLENSPLLFIKLLLVFLLTIVISIMAFLSKKAKHGDTEKHLKKLEAFSKVSFLLSCAIVILAVLIFH